MFERLFGVCASVPRDEAIAPSSVDEVIPDTSEKALEEPPALWKIQADEKIKLDEQRLVAKMAKEEEAAEALKAAKEEEEKAQQEKEAEATANSKAKSKAVAKKKLKAGEAVESKEDADLTKLNYNLEVKIISARGVRDADWAPGTGHSDPYCIAEVTGKPEKITTAVINDQKDPVWNATGKLVAAQTDSIQFSVFDSDVGKEDDLLGKVSLPCSKCVPAGWRGEIKMKQTSETAKAVNAFLRVKVTVLDSFVEGVEEKDAEPKAKAKAKAKGKAKAKA